MTTQEQEQIAALEKEFNEGHEVYRKAQETELRRLEQELADKFSALEAESKAAYEALTQAKLTVFFGDKRQVIVNQEMRDYAIAIAEEDMETASIGAFDYHKSTFLKTKEAMQLGLKLDIADLTWEEKLTVIINPRIWVKIPVDMVQRALADMEISDADSLFLL